jgi:hypothetical protein
MYGIRTEKEGRKDLTQRAERKRVHGEEPGKTRGLAQRY